MKKRKTITFDGEKLYLDVSSYRDNGRLAIIACTEDEIYADVTINLPDMLATNNTGFINTITSSCGLEEKLVKEGIITDILRTITL
ncbi:MAG: DUF4313 domain-containing protein [Clostridia bacterium]|nr:DUF4313 domain-containing protein [Clostridia bacterium]